MIAKEQHPIITGPLALILSDANVHIMTARKPAMFGGTVNSWALTLLYPRLEIIEGRKRENE